jgi:serine/threonine protein kinase
MMTGLAVILGTAAYMSPEQARAKAVDRRADVWAFGVVLVEMLTGRALFCGDTVTDIIAAIVTREPDLSALPATTATRVCELASRSPRIRSGDYATSAKRGLRSSVRSQTLSKVSQVCADLRAGS